jgi:hypothetical protein
MIMNYRIAGHETTAVTVDFILLQLARNPSVQRKLQQEIRSAVSLDYSTIVGLEYLNAVAKEGYVLSSFNFCLEIGVKMVCACTYHESCFEF